MELGGTYYFPFEANDVARSQRNISHFPPADGLPEHPSFLHITAELCFMTPGHTVVPGGRNWAGHTVAPRSHWMQSLIHG